MKKIELLAPAGDLEKLKIAVLYGADAVYFGGEVFSLRAGAGNLTIGEMKEGIAFAHERGVKCYLTINIFAHNRDIQPLREYLGKIKELNIDAFIVSDPGIICLIQEIIPDAEIHLSTQANMTNYQTANFWYNIGVKRIVLARELSFEEMAEIRQNTPEDLEYEAFVHGAMCISYSGRCLLSNFMIERDANQGMCAHPCRWKYALVEEQRPGQYYPIEEDDRGTYILNSRDLCMIEYIPQLVESGLASLKIEGRMKSVMYVSTVVNAYRMALDLYAKSVEEGKEFSLPKEIRNELNMVSHRPYTTGFYFGNPKEDGQSALTSKYVADCEISAVVLDYDEEKRVALVRQRNKFFVGDELSILAPYDVGRSFKVTDIIDENGEHLPSAPHPNQHVYIPCEQPLKQGDIFRKVKYNDE